MLTACFLLFLLFIPQSLSSVLSPPRVTTEAAQKLKGYHCGIVYNLNDYLKGDVFFWIPNESGCMMTIYTGRYNVEVLVDYRSPAPMPCGRYDYRYDWSCPYFNPFEKRCAQLLYSATRYKEPINWQQSGSRKTVVQSGYLKFLYCGVDSMPITVTITITSKSNTDNLDNGDETMIKIVIPTLAVVIFLVLLSVFILFAVKWRIFHGRNGTDASNPAHLGRRSTIRIPRREEQPPGYDDIHKYPLSEQYQRQISQSTLLRRGASVLSRISSTLRDSFRSSDTPPPNYASATVSQGQQPQIRDPVVGYHNFAYVREDDAALNNTTHSSNTAQPSLQSDVKPETVIETPLPLNSQSGCTNVHRPIRYDRSVARQTSHEGTLADIQRSSTLPRIRSNSLTRAHRPTRMTANSNHPAPLPRILSNSLSRAHRPTRMTANSNHPAPLPRARSNSLTRAHRPTRMTANSDHPAPLPRARSNSLTRAHRPTRMTANSNHPAPLPRARSYSLSRAHHPTRMTVNSNHPAPLPSTSMEMRTINPSARDVICDLNDPSIGAAFDC